MLKIVRNRRRTESDTEDDDDNEEEMPEDTGDRTYDISERDGATNQYGPFRKMTITNPHRRRNPTGFRIVIYNMAI